MNSELECLARRTEVGGPQAARGEIHIAAGARLPPGSGPEQDEQLEIGCHPPKVAESGGDVMRVIRPHRSTVGTGPCRVNARVAAPGISQRDGTSLWA